MGSNSKANHFYNAWQTLSERTQIAYDNYIVALDIVSLVDKPSFNNPVVDNNVIAAQYQIYNKLNQRMRFYQTRYESLEAARDSTFKLWIEFKKKGQ